MKLVDPLNRWARRIPVWAVWLVLLIPIPALFYQGATGGLGHEPIEALEHELGIIALQLLVGGLSITPLRRFVGLNLMKFRRALGLLSFTYVAAHLLVWAVLDVQIVSQMWADIIKRPYVTIGMAAVLLMLPLALTSNNWSVRKLGSRWRRLHKLTYIVVVLGAVHFLWVRKGVQIEPLIYLTAALGLLILRIEFRKRGAIVR